MADKFVIKGGRRLRGKVKVHGSKNAATKMMIASLLTDKPCFIKNVPLNSDTMVTKELCEAVGSRVFLDDKHCCEMETMAIKTSLVPELSRRNRIPILAIGPLLHRQGFAEVPVLSGCPIGHRPINFHVEALSKMGVRVERRANSYYAEAQNVHGELIELPYPSVGATENILLTAVLARGETQIRNAAVEPEIINLIEMLQAMGAKIDCDIATRIIKIDGVNKMCGVTVEVMSDRNEIISFGVAALATGGDIFVQGAQENYLRSFLSQVRAVGGFYEITPGGIRFYGKGEYRPAFIETYPHPGFMTDWQQPFCVLLTQAKGKSIIHETVYEDRLGYIKDLDRMGASIDISDKCPEKNSCRFFEQKFNHTAEILGPTKLRGSEITMTDIRAGMAMIIAALAAEGESIISGVEHIDRGYEGLDERLQSLGADIERI